jgi:D-galactarolactone isomerase
MHKREFLKAAAGLCLFGSGASNLVLGLTGCGTLDSSARTIRGERLEVPHSTGVEAPRTAAPVAATDCHIHIFDPRFPRPGGRSGVWATVADYQLFRRRIGVSRCIVVSPGSYEFDNSALVHGLDQFGRSARGVASIRLDVPDDELERLDARGVRGIRLYLLGEHPTKPDQLPQYARRIARLGWHIQIVAGRGAEKLIEAERFLVELPCPLVLDHFGYVPQPAGVQHPGLGVIRRLLDKGNTYVKLSAPYITSKSAPPSYSDIDELAMHLIRLAPERMLWGSDWPHPTAPKPVPDDAVLFDLLAKWAPDPATQRRILVENPQRLYWS